MFTGDRENGLCSLFENLFTFEKSVGFLGSDKCKCVCAALPAAENSKRIRREAHDQYAQCRVGTPPGITHPPRIIFLKAEKIQQIFDEGFNECGRYALAVCELSDCFLLSVIEVQVWIKIKSLMPQHCPKRGTCMYVFVHVYVGYTPTVKRKACHNHNLVFAWVPTCYRRSRSGKSSVPPIEILCFMWKGVLLVEGTSPAKGMYSHHWCVRHDLNLITFSCVVATSPPLDERDSCTPPSPPPAVQINDSTLDVSHPWDVSGSRPSVGRVRRPASAARTRSRACWMSR